MRKITHTSNEDSGAHSLGVAHDINSINFPNERYKKIAEIMQKLNILEESLHTKNRLLKTASVSPDATVNRVAEEISSAKKEMHDLLLKRHTYPEGPRLVLTESDAAEFDHQYRSSDFEFRDADAEDLAHRLNVIAGFQHELSRYHTNASSFLSEDERMGIIGNTTELLRSQIEHVMDVLTGVLKD